jgi:PAP2 superfamily protein
VKRALITLVASALGCSALAAALPAAGTAASAARAAPAAPPAATADPVVQWNRFLLGVQATPGVQPATVHPTYDLALVHTAIYDAVVAIHHSSRPYLPVVHVNHDASVAAAVDAAAHDALVRLYPGLRTAIDRQYSATLAQVNDSVRKTRGIRAGRLAAAQLLAHRANDGSGVAPATLGPDPRPGLYQPTPPALAAPVFTQWPGVTPFVLRRADQFRPPAPPPLTSPQYAAALNEVKGLGAATGSSRTADQTQIGVFWNPPIWATWNTIAQEVSVTRHATLADNARTFAVLNATFADSTIAFYDAKYAYRRWRPITAIRLAESDGNAATLADPAWTPLSNTAPDPSYPGAHATISAAASAVLRSVYGNAVGFAVTSAALPGVTRSFTSFSRAADEASVSRIYNGNHTRLDEVAGEDLGHDVARYVLRHRFLTPDSGS